MNAKRIFENQNISDTKKIEIFKQGKKDIKKYADYYSGKQDILFRQHPTDPSKNPKLNKLVFNLAEKIVDLHSNFLFGKKIELVNNSIDEDSFNLFENSWNNAKLQSHYLNLSKKLYSLSHVAEYIYVKEGKVNHTIFCPTKNELYVNFNEKDELDLFMREYSIQEYINGEVITLEYIEVYLPDKLLTYVLNNNQYTLVEELSRSYAKMPIVYYSIKEPLYWQHKSLLDRYNMINSVQADVIDTYSYPILMLMGMLFNFNANGEDSEGKTLLDYFKSGIPKILHLDNQDGEKANAEYLQQKGADESFVNETKNILNSILYLTSTPNISFENTKGIGNLSGIALKLMFLDTTLKSMGLQADFFHLTRSINLHKSALKSLVPSFNADIQIDAVFENPIPKNIKETIESIATAYSAEILSQETAISANPYVSNPSEELIKINSKVENIGASFI